MSLSNFDDAIYLEDLLYINKMRKNQEEKQYLGGTVSIKDIILYEVCFPFDGIYQGFTHLLSAHIPSGEDILDLMTMETLEEEAKIAVKEGKVKNMNEFWEAYKLCLDNPKLIKYRELSKEETRKVYGFT